MIWRRACGNCLRVYLREPDEPCKFCGYEKSLGSEDFEEEGEINRRNKVRLEEAEGLVCALKHHIAIFEKQWDDTWNVGTGQIEFPHHCEMYNPDNLDSHIGF